MDFILLTLVSGGKVAIRVDLIANVAPLLVNEGEGHRVGLTTGAWHFVEESAEKIVEIIKEARDDA